MTLCCPLLQARHQPRPDRCHHIQAVSGRDHPGVRRLRPVRQKQLRAHAGRRADCWQFVCPGGFRLTVLPVLQINRTFHAVTGHPFSLEHIDDGTKYLIHQIKNVRESQEFRSWTSEQKLIGTNHFLIYSFRNQHIHECVRTFDPNLCFRSAGRLHLRTRKAERGP